MSYTRWQADWRNLPETTTAINRNALNHFEDAFVSQDGRITTLETASGGGAVQLSVAQAKGDLIVATGPNAVTRVGVGGNGQVLTADSTVLTTGVKWATPAASGGSAITVQDEGTSLAQRSILNFMGAGVTASDDGASKTIITIPGGSGGVPTTRLITTSTGLTGGGDLSADRTLSVVTDTTTQRHEVAKAGTLVGTRKRLNLIEGSNVTIAAADNAGTNAVDVTISAASGTGSPADATTTTKGVVQLAGHLAGTAAAPTVTDNTSNQKLQLAQAGSVIGTRRQVNLIQGANVTLTTADNAGSDRVDVTIAAAAGGSGIPASTVTTKGDLIVATANATVARQPVASDGRVLTANSVSTTGVSWSALTYQTVQASGTAFNGRAALNFIGTGVTAVDNAGANRTDVTIANGPYTNVKDAAYGAKGDGTTDDTTAIQTALNGKGVVYFPVGTYKITSALTVLSDTVIVGAGRNSIILQTSTTANGIFGTALDHVTVRDICIQGPASGSGDGIHIVKGANANTSYIALHNIDVLQFGQDGISIENPIVSSLISVVTITNGRYGVNLFGQPAGAAGTSCALVSCFGNSNTTAGIRLFNMVYTSLDGCANDSQPIGYLIDTCQSVTLNGCGAESNTTNGIKVTGGFGVTINSPWIFDNRGVGIYITGNANTVTVIGATDNTPNAVATNFIKTDAGTHATIISQSNVTANSLQTTTTTSIDGGGGITVPAYATLRGGGEADGSWSTFGGDFVAGSVGFGLKVKEGTNAKMGTATLSAGSATVSTTAVTATSRVFLTAQVTGGTAGALRVSTRTAGTSFTITSTSGTDTSTVAWMIVEPAP